MYKKSQGARTEGMALKPDVALGYVSSYQDKKTGQTKKRIVVRIKADLLPQAVNGIIELVGFEPSTKTEKSPTFKLNANKPMAKAGGHRGIRQAASPAPLSSDDDDLTY